MILDSKKLMECVEWESVKGDEITIHVDGEKLKEEVYENLRIKLGRGELISLSFQDGPFIEIIPNELFDEDYCKQLSIELMNRLNNTIKAKLNIKD